MTVTPNKTTYTIEDLPEEVLEFILSLIPPYKDLHDCLQVSKRWRRCVLNVARLRQRNFSKSISEFDIAWQSVIPAAMAPTITERGSHAAVVHDNSVYVFGGCTSLLTTLNDLWRLDLSKRQWVRLLTMGTYPFPKAGCTMVCYKDSLVLFGGWTHTTYKLCNKLHVYDIVGNKWKCINTDNTPPPTLGHSVSVHGKWMVIFGGLQGASSILHSTESNDIWKLNLETWTWHKQETTDEHKKPVQRHGQSQTMLNDENLLMTGGTAMEYNDVWILRMTGLLWKWLPVEVRNSGDAPPNLWCIPVSVCKVENKIIVLSRIPRMYVLDISHALDEQPYVTWLPLQNHRVFSQRPEETVFYSLVAGESKLIMFGGNQKDVNSLSNYFGDPVTNSLHFITAPRSCTY